MIEHDLLNAVKAYTKEALRRSKEAERYRSVTEVRLRQQGKEILRANTAEGRLKGENRELRRENERCRKRVRALERVANSHAGRGELPVLERIADALERDQKFKDSMTKLSEMWEPPKTEQVIMPTWCNYDSGGEPCGKTYISRRGDERRCYEHMHTLDLP